MGTGVVRTSSACLGTLYEKFQIAFRDPHASLRGGRGASPVMSWF
jgi:hypothetical protein